MSEPSQNYNSFDYTDHSTGINYGAQGEDVYGEYNTYESAPVDSATGFKSLPGTLANEVVNKSFLFMVVGLIITAGAALTTSPQVAINLLTGGSFVILFVVELAIVFAGQAAVRKNKPIVAGILFSAYAYLTGMIFSVLFLVYTGESMVSTFLICAAMFAAMAVFGMITGKDLTGLGSICVMGLFGIILAGVVNSLFLHSSGMTLIVDVVAILIFCGLTAYDAKKIKQLAYNADSNSVLSLALFGAFELYLDFINLFLRLLRILGKKK